MSAPNLSIEPTEASHWAYWQIVAQWRLAFAARAER
jgi:hypothetical protein